MNQALGTFFWYKVLDVLIALCLRYAIRYILLWSIQKVYIIDQSCHLASRGYFDVKDLGIMKH